MCTDYNGIKLDINWATIKQKMTPNFEMKQFTSRQSKVEIIELDDNKM